MVAGYRVERLIGSGGMGIVYEATQISLDRKIALKVLSPHVSDDEEFRERFKREGALQAAVDNPAIVTVYEAGESEHGLYIAMRLVRGCDLKQLLIAGEASIEGVLNGLEQIADALDAAHAAGLIHRDVKPQNILVDAATGSAFLADFGLTKASGQNSLTRVGSYVGSLDYVSPEQIRGETLTPASDIYSLAAVLYEVFSGQVPYPKDTEAAILFAHLSDPPPPLSSIRPDLARLDPILNRGLSKSPADRYTGAGAMIRDAKKAWLREQTDRAIEAERALHDSGNWAADRRSETVIDRQPALSMLKTPEVGRQRHFPLMPVLLSAILIGVIAAAGFLLGHSRSSVRDPQLSAVSSGALTLRVPADWRRSAVSAKTAAALGLTHAIQLTAQDGETLIAGRTQSSGSALLPARLEKGRHIAPTLVRMGSIEAYRYVVAVPGQAGKAAFFVVAARPSGVGVACFGASASVPATGSCSGIVALLKLKGLHPLTPGPNEALAKTASSLLASLSSTSKRNLDALKRAKSAPQQAARAHALALSFNTASRRLMEAGAQGDTANATRLAAAARRISLAYKKLERAARALDTTAYQGASRSIRSSSRQLRNEIGGLKKYGYRVTGT
ncbi:MAG: serine/threonine-protein kinase [Gaiellaceae bacterium]